MMEATFRRPKNRGLRALLASPFLAAWLLLILGASSPQKGVKKKLSVKASAKKTVKSVPSSPAASAPATGEPAVTPKAAERSSMAVPGPGKKTLIDLSDVNIEGQLRAPDGGFFGSRKRTRFDSLVRVRSDFAPEISATAAGL